MQKLIAVNMYFEMNQIVFDCEGRNFVYTGFKQN